MCTRDAASCLQPGSYVQQQVIADTAHGMQNADNSSTQVGMLSVYHLCDAASVEGMREAVRRVPMGVGNVRIKSR